MSHSSSPFLSSCSVFMSSSLCQILWFEPLVTNIAPSCEPQQVLWEWLSALPTILVETSSRAIAPFNTSNSLLQQFQTSNWYKNYPVLFKLLMILSSGNSPCVQTAVILSVYLLIMYLLLLQHCGSWWMHVCGV